MTTLRRILITATFAVVASGLASASSIQTFSATVGPGLTDYSFTLTLPKFNPTAPGPTFGAVLNSVTLSFSSTDDILNLSLNNTATTAQTFLAKAQSDVFLNSNSAASDLTSTDLFLLLFNSGAVQLGPNGSPACAAGSPNAGCDPVAYNPPSVTGSTGNFVSPTPLSYQGTGNFTLGGFTLSGYSVTGGGNNINVSLTTQDTNTATVVYTYTVPGGTPEPATMLLFGSGMIGLGLLRKRIGSKG